MPDNNRSIQFTQWRTHPEERLLAWVLGQELLHAGIVGRHLLPALRQPAPAGLLVLFWLIG